LKANYVIRLDLKDPPALKQRGRMRVERASRVSTARSRDRALSSEAGHQRFGQRFKEKMFRDA